MNFSVSVIIVTCGKSDYLDGCITSVKKQDFADLEVIIVANQADEDIRARLFSLYPQARVCLNRENLYYCQSLNQGINLSEGDFILCLNDDVVLEANFINRALDAFCHDEKIGMVSGKILRADKSTIDSTGLFLSLYRTARERGYGKPERGQYQQEEYIFGVNGAVAFYRKKMLNDIKEEDSYFDPDFKIFYEDLDIAWRAARRHWKAYYTPFAVAYHVRGGTVRNQDGINRSFARRYLNDELSLLLIKNRHKAMIKNEDSGDFLLHLPFIAAFEIFSFVYIVFFKPQLLKDALLSFLSLRKIFLKTQAIKSV